MVIVRLTYACFDSVRIETGVVGTLLGLITYSINGDMTGTGIDSAICTVLKTLPVFVSLSMIGYTETKKAIQDS